MKTPVLKNNDVKQNNHVLLIVVVFLLVSILVTMSIHEYHQTIGARHAQNIEARQTRINP